MVMPRYRSRSKRRVFVRTPKGVKLTYRDRKPSVAHCGSCGAVLKGIPRVRSSRLCKSEKRPSRPYGGKLCSKCMRKEIIKKVVERFKGGSK